MLAVELSTRLYKLVIEPSTVHLTNLGRYGGFA